DPERPYSLLIPYGLDYQGAEVLPSSPEHPFLRISFPSEGKVVETNLVGSYNADNVMAAVAVGQQFGVTFDEAAAAISAYMPSNNRSQMVRTGRNTLIVDAYNANPTSMEAALKNFASLQAESKAALLGDMLELGEDSLAEHIRIVSMALESGIGTVCFVGGEFRQALEQLHNPSALSFLTSAELAEWLSANPISESSVLIKGSRGTRMEKVIEKL
ncbi:MAG: UDP-N-acetylmuramoyl-tripeptide--D-alanyl-D-alanine ligase, partial [Bacteroidales bacterium]|nr:UDP-N-acetylmuramoyl-tripeptide--D-alanyl-D-alanine ligase [Bacteroidales bacterium]